MPSADVVKKDNEKERLRLVDDIQESIIDNIHNILKHDDIDFTGDMSASFVKGKEGDFPTVETDNKYAGFIEFGMPAGEDIDYDKLRIWVEFKVGIPEGDELTAVTNIIYKRIKSNGIQPRRYMRKAIRKFVGMSGTTSIKSGGSNTPKKQGFSSKVKKAVTSVKKLISDFKSSKMVKKIG